MSNHPNWRALATVPFSLKTFIKESSKSGEDSRNSSEKRWKKFKCSLKGEECRAAYEQVIALPSQSSGPHVANITTEKTSVTPPKTKAKVFINEKQRINFLMKEASNNNVEGIVSMLSNSDDVNVTDEFGWSMLMCASQAGAVDVVQFLLQNGADMSIRDKSGNTCKTLARRQRQAAILQLFRSINLHEEETRVHKDSPVAVYCEKCDDHFMETPKTSHFTSTIHLFNSCPRSQRTFYGIPETNKGYEILVRTGWNRERGLGPEGLGNKYPLKTVLKSDRKGIGCNSGSPRVTHFKPYDTQAVENPYKKFPKVSRKSQVEKDRRKERRLRRELNF